MHEHIKSDISIRPKPEVVNIAKVLDKYLAHRTKATNPDIVSYEAMADFIEEKINKLMGAGYLPLSKFERRVASKLYDILSTETIIHQKIAKNQDTANRDVKLYEAKKDLFMTILGNIYTSKYTEPKILGSFKPEEIVTLLDIFEEETIEIINKHTDEDRNKELAAWVTGDDDDTDAAQTFYEKVVEHHETNRPIWEIIEDITNTKNITRSRIFRKTVENAKVMRWYFWQYPQVFIISFLTVLDYDQMLKAVEAIFPEKYMLPDIRWYIDRWYNIENPDEQYWDED